MILFQPVLNNESQQTNLAYKASFSKQICKMFSKQQVAIFVNLIAATLF